MNLSFTADEILQIAKPQLTKGSTNEVIRGIASLKEAQLGDLSFLGNAKYKTEVAQTRASVVFLPTDFSGEPQSNQLFIFVEQPSLALAHLCLKIEQALWPRPPAGVHPSSVVSPKAIVAKSAIIGPLCVVEDGAVIGEDTYLQAQVFIGRQASVGSACWLMAGAVVSAECTVGNRVRIHPGGVIGADGFGYEFAGGRHEKVPQIGTVVVGDDVEIGANSTIDRSRFSRTEIGEGTKIDNLVMVGHNVIVGRHCLICAQVGIAGSSIVEDYVVLGGQAGIVGHITIGKGSKVNGQTGVHSDLAAGSSVTGTPGLPYMLEQRINVLKKRLPELFKRVGVLEERSK